MAYVMMKHTTCGSNITLPLLIAYIEALLPSLVERQTTIENKDDDDTKTQLLWAVQDYAESLTLQAQLSVERTAKNSCEISTSHQVTLPELAHHALLKRYELVCFWLPTLSEEVLQQYIPLLMRYRDLYAAHLLIALDETIDLRAYGFTPFDILSEQASTLSAISIIESASKPLTLWQFNLYDYKQLPNWLNADYWANPENWGKHRW